MTQQIWAIAAASLLFAACSPKESAEAPAEPARLKLPDAAFTIAMIPDPQNYVSYDHQRSRNFPINAVDQYLDQMRYVVANAESMGGDIAFMTIVGDLWNHSSIAMDPDHLERGFKRDPDPKVDEGLAPTEWTRAYEMRMSQRGIALIEGKLPFSVVPGNHDFDAAWSEMKRSPGAQPPHVPQVHTGGLTNFVSVYGADSQFFSKQPWYVASNDGGADNAQIFEAGGYRFLHIGLQYSPPDRSLEWAAGVIAKYPGLPTIVSTHDHLNPAGLQEPHPSYDEERLDPGHDNSPSSVWKKFLGKHDQIFLVLSGHRSGQSRRVDKNEFGHDVHQVMADYQSRSQTLLDANYTSASGEGVGDGWLRLLQFNMATDAPVIDVRTYSTHYQRFSRDIPEYARWYRAREQPKMTDEEFLDAENFVLKLADFRERFDATAKLDRQELEPARP